ncbi:hypothetical protein PENTCL1PPCAC_29815, partial [Pristionchus entomophagus]
VITWQNGMSPDIETVANEYLPLPSSDTIFVMGETGKEVIKMEVETKTKRNIEQPVSSCRNFFLISLTSCISLLLFALALYPHHLLGDYALRACAVTITVAVIVLGRVAERQSWIMSNRVIVYLGDISYVVYLVHWPVMILWKSYWDLPELPLKDIASCVAITFIMSILIHHTLETMFITASSTASFLFVGVIYMFITVAVLFHLPYTINSFVEHKVPTDASVANALVWNDVQVHTPYHHARPFEECEDDPEGMEMRDGFSTQSVYECIWKPNHPSGSVSILVVGNSIAHRATKILHPILENNENLKEMRLFAHSACRPFENCPEFFSAMIKLVERMKPDITFLIYDDSPRLREPIKDMAKDQSLASLIDFLKPISSNSKYLVLDEFYPLAGTIAGVAKSMYKRLLQNRTLDDLKKRYKTFTHSHSSYFRRLDQLPSHFPNLIRHNTSGPLCSEQPGWCWWYNRKNLHAYYTDNLHFTADGLELERESYTKILEDLIQRVLNNKTN